MKQRSCESPALNAPATNRLLLARSLSCSLFPSRFYSARRFRSSFFHVLLVFFSSTWLFSCVSHFLCLSLSLFHAALTVPRIIRRFNRRSSSTLCFTRFSSLSLCFLASSFPLYSAIPMFALRLFPPLFSSLRYTRGVSLFSPLIRFLVFRGFLLPPLSSILICLFARIKSRM